MSLTETENLHQRQRPAVPLRPFEDRIDLGDEHIGIGGVMQHVAGHRGIHRAEGERPRGSRRLGPPGADPARSASPLLTAPR
jgi:hypothetical protein